MLSFLTVDDTVKLLETLGKIFTPVVLAYIAYLSTKIHKLTNSAMTEQKRISWVSAETLAVATPGNEGHVALAKEAREAYHAALPANQRKS